MAVSLFIIEKYPIPVWFFNQREKIPTKEE